MAEGSKARVRQPHDPGTDRFPQAAAGERVLFHRFDQKYTGWFFGKDARGTEGYFPVARFDIDQTRKLALARCDYDATELTVNPGDRIRVLGTLSGWHRVETEEGRRGWIPGRCLAG